MAENKSSNLNGGSATVADGEVRTLPLNSIDERLARLRNALAKYRSNGPYRSERTQAALEMVLLDDAWVSDAARACGVSSGSIYRAIHAEGLDLREFRRIA